MNITIFASIGSQNLGDELILKNEIQLLKEEFGENVQFRVASYDLRDPFFSDESVEYFEYFPIGIKNPKNIFRNMKNAGVLFRNIAWSDLVVIGGGGIIYDNEKQSNYNPLNQWLFRSTITRVFRKKLYFYALGIDVKDQKTFNKLERIFKNTWKITVRDDASQKQLQSLGIESTLVDDPVMYEGGSGKGRILGMHNSDSVQVSDLKSYDLSGKKIGLALRSGYFGKDQEHEKELIEKLCQYIESQGSKVILLPHSFHMSDSMANDYNFLRQFLTEEREIKESMQEVYAVYTHKLTHLNITMRLHSIILSHVYGVEQIALSYSSKTNEVLKKLSE